MKTQVTEKQAMRAAHAKALIMDEQNAMGELTPSAFVHNIQLICRETGKSFVEVVESVKDFALKDHQRRKELARLKRSDELEFEQAWETAMPSYVSFTGNRNAATN